MKEIIISECEQCGEKIEGDVSFLFGKAVCGVCVKNWFNDLIGLNRENNVNNK